MQFSFLCHFDVHRLVTHENRQLQIIISVHISFVDCIFGERYIELEEKAMTSLVNTSTVKSSSSSMLLCSSFTIA